MYGTYILNAASTGDLYASKYKGIWICFQTLARALGGNYVMYAVFDLYGDPCLKVSNSVLTASSQRCLSPWKNPCTLPLLKSRSSKLAGSCA